MMMDRDVEIQMGLQSTCDVADALKTLKMLIVLVEWSKLGILHDHLDHKQKQ